MNHRHAIFTASLGFIVVFLFAAGTSFGQQASGSLLIRLKDQLGGLVVGANVKVADAHNNEKFPTLKAEGTYLFAGLAPGKYTLRVAATGFKDYQKPDIEITASHRTVNDVTLEVSIDKQTVTVTKDSPINTRADENASALVLHGSDLDALPDDPEDLAAALIGLAGPAPGMGGAQFFVDGFSSGRIPPKQSISEIRINQNPFSAEFDRLGFGRIEIYTRPGSDKYQGEGYFNFNDEALNSRNPFAPTRAPYAWRLFGGNLGGPIRRNKSSFFVDFERREVQDNALINAVILDPSLSITPFRRSIVVPQQRMTLSPRLDFQLNPLNTLMARYSFTSFKQQKIGVGQFALESQAVDNNNIEHTIQVSESSVLSPALIDETRFQYVYRRRRLAGNSPGPTISVLEAFTDGGTPDSVAETRENRWELQNIATLGIGRSTLRVGGRLRRVSILDSSLANFNGTYTFGGGQAPLLDANNHLVRDSDGQIVFGPITSIERYRRTLLFQGLSPAEIRALGGGANQFLIAAGTPEAKVSRFDIGVFAQNDWRARPNFTLSAGIRYENQNNITSRTNFGPRLAFAWMPGAGPTRRPKLVIRGGAGVFYDRFSENLTLQANRFDGTKQELFVVLDPTILDLFPNVPPSSSLSSFATSQTLKRVADDLQSPYTIQFSISVERQLPYKFTLSTTFIRSRMLHVLRSRNINAPFLDTPTSSIGTNIVRPLGDVGNIYQVESSGRFDQNQLIISVNNRLTKKLTMFSTYVLNRAKSDTNGAQSFPAYQYELENEYGRSLFDIHHSVTAGGTITAPWGIYLNPLIIYRSSAPFNITTGRDTNGDTLFTERPAFATDLTKPGVLITRFGAFDPTPGPGEQIIPRNFGVGPGFFSINLRVSKTFRFKDKAGGVRMATQNRASGGQESQRPSPSAFVVEKRYALTVAAQVQNFLNHPNLGPTIGNLTSPSFGQSISTAGNFGTGVSNAGAGNRRIELQLRLSF
jgi:hypothetical protein